MHYPVLSLPSLLLLSHLSHLALAIPTPLPTSPSTEVDFSPVSPSLVLNKTLTVILADHKMDTETEGDGLNNASLSTEEDGGKQWIGRLFSRSVWDDTFFKTSSNKKRSPEPKERNHGTAKKNVANNVIIETVTSVTLTTTTTTIYGRSPTPLTAASTAESAIAPPPAPTTTSTKATAVVVPTTASAVVIIATSSSIVVEPTPSSTPSPSPLLTPSPSSSPAPVPVPTPSTTLPVAVDTSSATPSPPAPIPSATTATTSTSTTTSTAPVPTVIDSPISGYVGIPGVAGLQQTGQATYFEVGLGSCGSYSVDSDYLVAISHLVMDGFPGATNNPNTNPACGRQILASYGGKSVTVTVLDTCEGCAAGDLDFSPSAFQQLASQSLGRLDGLVWAFL